MHACTLTRLHFLKSDADGNYHDTPFGHSESFSVSLHINPDLLALRDSYIFVNDDLFQVTSFAHANAMKQNGAANDCPFANIDAGGED
jgi:hypothetical protein